MSTLHINESCYSLHYFISKRVAFQYPWNATLSSDESMEYELLFSIHGMRLSQMNPWNATLSS